MTTTELQPMDLSRQPKYDIKRFRVFQDPAQEGLIMGMSTKSSEKLLETGTLQRWLGKTGYALSVVPAETARDDTYSEVQVKIQPPMSEEHLQALGHDLVTGALEDSWSPARINVATEGIAFTDHRRYMPTNEIDSGPYVIASSLRYALQQPGLRAVS